MSQALAAAEQATGGKAVGTGIEDRDGTVHFEVKILKYNVRQKALVDPQTTQVVKSVLAGKDDEGDTNESVRMSEYQEGSAIHANVHRLFCQPPALNPRHVHIAIRPPSFAPNSSRVFVRCGRI